MIAEKDVAVPMRDGVNLSIDIYRPDTAEKFPALLAFSIYNKDLQGPDVAKTLPPQPAWSSLWAGLLEAGDTKFFVSRGYVHIIGSPRGVAKSDGGGSRQWDSYDLIEWIAAQPWCDGNVGMVGISGFGAEQFHVARQNPPHLKAIFPLDPRGAYGDDGKFSRGIPRRGAASLPLSDHAFCRHASDQRQAWNAAAGARSALAGSDEQPGLPDVSAYLQRADAEGSAHAALLRSADRSLTTRRRRSAMPSKRSNASRCRPIPVPVGTLTPTKPISTGHRTISRRSRRRRN